MHKTVMRPSNRNKIHIIQSIKKEKKSSPLNLRLAEIVRIWWWISKMLLRRPRSGLLLLLLSKLMAIRLLSRSKLIPFGKFMAISLYHSRIILIISKCRPLNGSLLKLLTTISLIWWDSNCVLEVLNSKVVSVLNKPSGYSQHTPLKCW